MPTSIVVRLAAFTASSLAAVGCAAPLVGAESSSGAPCTKCDWEQPADFQQLGDRALELVSCKYNAGYTWDSIACTAGPDFDPERTGSTSELSLALIPAPPATPITYPLTPGTTVQIPFDGSEIPGRFQIVVEGSFARDVSGSAFSMVGATRQCAAKCTEPCGPQDERECDPFVCADICLARQREQYAAGTQDALQVSQRVECEVKQEQVFCGPPGAETLDSEPVQLLYADAVPVRFWSEDGLAMSEAEATLRVGEHTTVKLQLVLHATGPNRPPQYILGRAPFILARKVDGVDRLSRIDGPGDYLVRLDGFIEPAPVSIFGFGASDSK